jgi:hypothetical protein
MNAQDARSKKWRVVIPVIIIALGVGWYWFRPERLVTNRRVDEALPAIDDSAVQILELGPSKDREIDFRGFSVSAKEKP